MHCILCQLPSASQQHLTAVQFYIQTSAISHLRMYCNYRHSSPWFAAFAMLTSPLNSPLHGLQRFALLELGRSTSIHVAVVMMLCEHAGISCKACLLLVGRLDSCPGLNVNI